MLKLHPVEALHHATVFCVDEKMLFRIRVPEEVDNLPAHVAEVLAEGQLGGRELIGGDGLTLHLTLQRLPDCGGLALGKRDQRN
jgi:hypothetical protein